LGHDMSRGVSTFVRPERVAPPVDLDEPLGPDDLVNDAQTDHEPETVPVAA